MKKIIKNSKIYDEEALNLGLDSVILMENAGLNLLKILRKFERFCLKIYHKCQNFL